MNPTKTMLIEVGTFNKLCEERQALRTALVETQHTLQAFNYQFVKDRFYANADILTRTKEG